MSLAWTLTATGAHAGSVKPKNTGKWAHLPKSLDHLINFIARRSGRSYFGSVRVTRKADGSYVIEDSPMQLDGSAAKAVLDDLRKRDASGNDPERARFLDECSRIYRASKP